MSAPVALVTGGAVRVGRAIALGLGRAGFDVAFSYHRSAEAAEGVVAELEGLGRRAHAVAVDLTAPEAADVLVASARGALGPLDALVCSAASFVREPLAAVTAEGFDAQLALNLRAPTLLARAAAADLGRAGRGRIVNIADLSGERPFPGFLVHGASKAALINLTLGLAVELAPAIGVNAVIPGPVAPPEGWSAEEIARVIDRTPMGRPGSPQDVAEAVVWLATCTSFVTGAVIHVDGGRHALGL